ncbi:hypothetical protein GBF38_000382, partial [Nibea albiflora]
MKMLDVTTVNNGNQDKDKNQTLWFICLLLPCEVTDGNKVQQQFPFRLQPSGEKPGWWRFIIVSLGLAALIVIVVAVSMWTRTKGRKTQMDENVVMTERENNDEVTLSCSVSVFDECKYRVEWLSEGKDKDKETSQPRCSDHFTYKKKESKKYKSFNCEVTDFYTGKVKQFPFRLQPSGEKPGNQRPPEGNTVSYSARRRRVMRSGAADSQVKVRSD